MPNAALSEKLITEKTVSESAEWLIALGDRLRGAAPDYSHDRHDYMVALRAALGDYKTHRTAGDPGRVSTYRSLSKSVMAHITNFTAHLSSGMVHFTTPSTEAQFEDVVADILAKRDWRTECQDCGRSVRGTAILGKRRYCATCYPAHLFTCQRCLQHGTKEGRATIRFSEARKTMNVCSTCVRELDVRGCSVCAQLYCGVTTFSGPHAAELNTDTTDVCYICADKWFVADCGHPTFAQHKISHVDNVEDDDRERDEIRYKTTTCCRKCYTASMANNRASHWTSSKRSVGGRSFKEIGSRRTYGVELEVLQPRDMDPMPETMKAVWTAKHDDSLPRDIGGVEMASTILKGDEGLAVIRDLCQYARDHGWKVDCKAGYHLHVGLTDTPMEEVAAVAIGYLCTYNLWTAFVAPSRSHCRYCRRNRPTAQQLVSMPPNHIISKLTAEDDRRVWCNWHSYLTRATIELRVHHGTLDPIKIVNWVKAHVRFVDWCCKIGDRAKVFELLNSKDPRKQLLYLAQEAWHDRDLAAWFRKRSETLHGDASCIRQSNRTLRKRGIDPNIPSAASDEIIIDGCTAYVMNYGGTWVIQDSNIYNDRKSALLTTYGKWTASTGYKQFASKEEALLFARDAAATKQPAARARVRGIYVDPTREVGYWINTAVDLRGG